MGAKKDGMCNICELLINAVMVYRPKMLKGLDQNGKGYGWNARMSLHAVYSSLGGQADNNPSCKIMGKGGRKKQMPSCNGVDTSSNFARHESGQTSDGCAIRLKVATDSYSFRPPTLKLATDSDLIRPFF